MYDGLSVEVTTLTTSGDNSLLRGLRTALEGADQALLCVAFVQKAGVHLLRAPLEQLGARARLLHTTTFTECSTALGMAHGFGANVAILNQGSGTYHPKIYLARRPGELVAVIGSANLTGGLVNNVEAAVMLRGTESDEPIRSAWEFAEGLWADPRRRAWDPVLEGATDEETFAPELYGELVAAVDTHHHVFHTLGPNPKPNRIVGMTPAGLYVSTPASCTCVRGRIRPRSRAHPCEVDERVRSCRSVLPLAMLGRRQHRIANDVHQPPATIDRHSDSSRIPRYIRVPEASRVRD